MPAKQAIFLDRDGVLNRAEVRDGKPFAPTRLEDFEILPGVWDALTSLKQAGFFLVVVTNQPDVGHGLVSRSVVDDMHERLMNELPLDDVRVCFHKQSEGCTCRKPNAGMLLDAATEHDIDLTNSFMIGDRAGDVVAGKTAGCHTVFLDRGYSENERVDDADMMEVSLSNAAEKILILIDHDVKVGIDMGMEEKRGGP